MTRTHYSSRCAVPNAITCMECPDIRGRSESNFHLARELASRMRPVDMTGSRPSSLECSLTVIQTVTASGQIKHHVLRGNTQQETTLECHDEGLPRIPGSHYELQAPSGVAA